MLFAGKLGKGSKFQYTTGNKTQSHSHSQLVGRGVGIAVYVTDLHHHPGGTSVEGVCDRRVSSSSDRAKYPSMLCRNQARTREFQGQGAKAALEAAHAGSEGVQSNRGTGHEVEGLKGSKKKNFVECNRLDL